MIIGINASNIISTGGIHHLVNLIEYSDPNRDKFTKLIVWAPISTIKKIPNKEWIHLVDENEIGQNLYQRLFSNIINKKNKFLKDCDVLINLSGFNISNFKPNIIMIQNQVHFEYHIIFKLS